jgi:hypothetical protein
MTHVTYRMTCDNCNRREHSVGDETEFELFETASAAGWEFRGVPNGSIWHLCLEFRKLTNDELN